jgi:hypothetical protein
LRDGPRGFPRGFSGPVVLGRELGRQGAFAYRAITYFGRAFQLASANPLFCNSPGRSGGPVLFPQPRRRNAPELARHRFGLFPVRSPLLGESLLLSLPEGTEMVHFPSLASATYEFSRGSRGFPRWVAPFGNPRINACLRLPEAYRSLLRPSSPSCAKASTACP